MSAMRVERHVDAVHVAELAAALAFQLGLGLLLARVAEASSAVEERQLAHADRRRRPQLPRQRAPRRGSATTPASCSPPSPYEE